MPEYRLTEAGRIGLRMLLDAESLYLADRRGLHLLGMEDVVDLPDEWVEPAPPPLPPQPEPGVYMLGENAEVGQCYVWVYGAGANVMVFYYGGHSGWIPWAEAWELAGGEGVAIRRLVPTPEPVTLPWHLSSINGWGHGDVRCQPADNPNAPVSYSIDDERRWLTVSEARAMAAALLSAADQAEASHE